MYAITGITGKVGGTLARTLLAKGRTVRAVVRDANKGEEWAVRGCDVVIAEMDDAAALATAFTGATAVFILPPPVFDPAPGYPEMRKVIGAVTEALLAAKPGRVLCLSTVGAQATQDNLLTQLSMMEKALSTLSMPVSFLRPGWYLENSSWDVASARETGVVRSFLTPLDKHFPMVSIRDVGRVAAELIQQEWSGIRIVELEGPRRVSPNALASAFAKVLGTAVRAEAVPRASWEDLFRSQGMQYPRPRARMLDGFNQGWIDFAAGEASSIKGLVDPDQIIADLVQYDAVGHTT
jgi:uncharacterized protein YbjT (DUF2867 family)